MRLIFSALCMVLALTASSHAGAGKTFHGLPCKSECKGHQAGYDWAEKKALNTEEHCTTKSKSFNEGCIIRVKERQAIQSSANSAQEN